MCLCVRLQGGGEGRGDACGDTRFNQGIVGSTHGVCNREKTENNVMTPISPQGLVWFHRF